MTDDALKLTTYFGERQRTDGGLVADALLDVYGRREIHTSVLLRGVEGFGLKHHLRTDRLLSLSEDLPVVSVAVDARARIEQALPEVMAIKRRGLTTLERARIVSGASHAPAAETKLTIYFGRRERVLRTPAFVSVCDLLSRRGVAGATVLLGVDGTARGRRERARFVGRNADVPLMIIAVGSAERIAGVVPEIGELVPAALLTVERVQVCKRDGELLARPRAVVPVDAQGLATWQKLMIHTAEDAGHEGTPVHIALVRALRETGARGATTLRGIWGFHGDHAPHGDRLLQVRRHVPVVTIVVDSPERIARSFDVVDRLTRDRGLVTAEIVPALVELGEGRRRGGLRLAERQP